MKAPLAREAEGVEVTGGSLFLQAMRYACLYERFGLVSFSQATTEQLATVAEWVSSGELPQSRMPAHQRGPHVGLNQRSPGPSRQQ